MRRWAFLKETVADSPARALAREARRLLAPDRRLGVPIPAYEGRSLPNLTSGLARALGTPGAEPPPLPSLTPQLDPLDGRTPEGTVVVFLVDGLGWEALTRSAARRPGGPAFRWLERAFPLTSVFPTTTTVALTSLSSGSAPGQHGVVGHRVYLPRYGSVVEVLRMSPLGVSTAETLVGADWSPSEVSGVPSIFRRGIPGVALSRDRYEGSGFTRLIYEGAGFVAYTGASDLALSLVDQLSRPEPPPLLFVYRDDLDVAQHVRGPLPDLVDLELEQVDLLLGYTAGRLSRSLTDRTTLIITGDHGQVPMSPERQLVADRDSELLSLLSRPPAGDRRATYFTARPGQRAGLREALEARLPEGGHLLDLSEAVEGGLYGPRPWHPELLERLGDFLVLFPSPGGVSYTVPGARPRSRPMLGAHGGLEPDELLVPLVSGALSDFASPSDATAHLRAGADRSR